MMRRPPIFIGGTPVVPPMPWVKPGITPVRENVMARPFFHDESKTVPFLYSAPTYCTVTLDVGVAAAPLPTTRSLYSSFFGFTLDLAVTPGMPPRSAAPTTFTPLNVTFGPLAARAFVDGAW